jgi:hypothetical protein
MAYALIGKIYTSIYYFLMKGIDFSSLLTLHLPNLIIIIITFISVFYIVSKRKFNYIIGKKFLLLSTCYGLWFHFQISFWDFFTKNPNSSNLIKTIVIGDIPNLILIIYFVFFVIRVILNKGKFL